MLTAPEWATPGREANFRVLADPLLQAGSRQPGAAAGKALEFLAASSRRVADQLIFLWVDYAVESLWRLEGIRFSQSKGKKRCHDVRQRQDLSKVGAVDAGEQRNPDRMVSLAARSLPSTGLQVAEVKLGTR